MEWMNRREFIALATAIGASFAWGGRPVRSDRRWVERRDLFAQGVASGDPDSSSVVVWTRASVGTEDRVGLTLEVAEDPAFDRVIATTRAQVSTVIQNSPGVVIENSPLQVSLNDITRSGCGNVGISRSVRDCQAFVEIDL
jgi:phosphodiesterase/alkaline phosphatase D-like protein